MSEKDGGQRGISGGLVAGLIAGCTVRFRGRISREVLRGLKSLSPASISRLESAVDDCVTVPGFRPGKGKPSRRLGPGLAGVLQDHLAFTFPPLAPAVIQAWLELKGSVLEEARLLLKEGGFEEFDPAPYPELVSPGGFDALYEWMKDRLAGRPEDERDDLLLAGWALNQWGRPAENPNDVSDEQGGTECEEAGEDGVSTADARQQSEEHLEPATGEAPIDVAPVLEQRPGLADLVAGLRSAFLAADPEDTGWSELERLAAEAANLRERKRAEQQAAREWQQTLAGLLGEWATVLAEKFEVDTSLWQGARVVYGGVPDVVGFLQELRDRLCEWRDLTAALQEGSLPERKAKRQRLDLLEDSISEVVRRIRQQLEGASTARTVEAAVAAVPRDGASPRAEPKEHPPRIIEPANPDETASDPVQTASAPAPVEATKAVATRGDPAAHPSEGGKEVPETQEPGPGSPVPVRTEREDDRVHSTGAPASSEKQRPETAGVLSEESPVVDEDLLSAANRRAWELAGEGATPLALQICRELDRQSEEVPFHLRGDEVALLHLAPYVFPGVDEVLERAEAASRALLDEPTPDPRSTDDSAVSRLILRAATLPRIVLFAPNGAAHALLRQLVLEQWGFLAALRERVEAILRLGVELSPVMLRGDSSEAEQARYLREWRTHATEWLRLNRQTGVLNIASATDVLHAWARSEGPLGGALEKAIADAPSAADVARRISSRWKERTFVQAEVVKQDRSYRGTRADRNPIEARAREVLLHRAESAAKLLLRWLELTELRTAPRKSHADKEFLKCRHELFSAAAEARAHLTAAATAAERPIPTGAFRAAMRATTDLVSVLSSDFAEVPCEPFDPEQLVRDLFRVPGLVLDAELAPPPGKGLLPELLSLSPSPDWPATFEAQKAARNPWAMEQIARVLGQNAPDGKDDGRATAIREVREKREAELRSSLADAKRAIGRGTRYSLLPEAELQDLRASVETIVPRVTRDYEWTANSLATVIACVEEGEERRAAEAHDRMVAAASKMLEADRERVERALKDRNYSVVDDYLDRVEAGEPIDEARRETDPFDGFFPAFVRGWSELMTAQPRPTNQTVVQAIRRRERLGPVDGSTLDDEAAQGGGNLVEAWMRAKERLGSTRASQIKDILLGIGFSDASIQGNPPSASPRWVTSVNVAKIHNREICAVPHWGSVAGGRYQLVCQWAPFTAESLISGLNVEPGRPPAIVLAFGLLTENARREMATICREKRKSALVLDEALLMYLASCGESRLRAFFQCALPFTHSDPYLTNAGILPEEMFFGRTRERENILKPEGTCLVYGGRQLGKTALLRDVERRYHDPDRGVFVRWLDLRADLVGTARRLEDVWNVLGASLQQEGVVSGATPTAETFERAISKWLGQKTNRILFLLDEADAFLEADRKQGEGYPVLRKLKQLMDKTERRFKVVFAGLHNVQRTSREANTPLAHLGRPTCIGPLLEGGEAGEALNLIQVPLRACGYRFEGNGADLPVHILSHTNYYPSLIQIYCKHLLAYLDGKRTRPEYRSAPPFLITQKHLDEAQDQKLRDEIRHRFRLTLDLDPRYRVIGLCIAHQAAAPQGRSILVEGVDVNWVRDQALSWWKQGFAGDTSLESFRTILDEMVGLGLLRPTGAGRWTLRSHNVLNVLGTRQEIEEDLLDASEKEPAPDYEPAAIRRPDPDDSVRRSPLTGQQETDLLSYENGASVLFGVPMGGLNEASRFLRLAAPGAPVHEISEVGTRSALVSRLEQVLTGTPDGLSFAVIPPEVPWTPDWIVGALQAFKARTVRRGSTVRVVFVGDAQAAWGWTDPASRDVEECKRRMVRVVSLRPWSEATLGLWLQDQAILSSAEERRNLLDLSGGWPSLLEEWAKRNPRDGKPSVPSMQELLKERSSDRTWRPALGLAREFSDVLVSFAEYGPLMSLADLEMVSQGTTPRSAIERVLAWSELIGIISKEGGDSYALNPFVAKIVKSLT